MAEPYYSPDLYFGLPLYAWGAVLLFILYLFLLLLLIMRSRRSTQARTAAPSRPGAGATNLPPPIPGKTGATMPPPMPGGVTLIAVSGPLQGKRFDLKLSNRVIFGRNPSVCDVAAHGDDMISGRHCEFSMVSGKVYVRDLGSLNGTIVNGKTLSEAVSVSSGDVLLLGETEFQASLV